MFTLFQLNKENCNIGSDCFCSCIMQITIFCKFAFVIDSTFIKENIQSVIIYNYRVYSHYCMIDYENTMLINFGMYTFLDIHNFLCLITNIFTLQHTNKTLLIMLHFNQIFHCRFICIMQIHFSIDGVVNFSILSHSHFD